MWVLIERTMGLAALCWRNIRALQVSGCLSGLLWVGFALWAGCILPDCWHDGSGWLFTGTAMALWQAATVMAGILIAFLRVIKKKKKKKTKKKNNNMNLLIIQLVFC